MRFSRRRRGGRRGFLQKISHPGEYFLHRRLRLRTPFRLRGLFRRGSGYRLRLWRRPRRDILCPKLKIPASGGVDGILYVFFHAPGRASGISRIGIELYGFFFALFEHGHPLIAAFTGGDAGGAAPDLHKTADLAVYFLPALGRRFSLRQSCQNACVGRLAPARRIGRSGSPRADGSVVLWRGFSISVFFQQGVDYIVYIYIRAGHTTSFFRS